MARPRSIISPKLTAWSMIALLAGLALGLLGQWVATGPITALAAVVRPFGSVWINALQMTVIPLVVTQILAALIRSSHTRGLGSLGGRTLAVFVLMLVGAGIVTMTLTPVGLQWYTPDPGIVSAMQVESIPPQALEAAQGGRTTLGEYLSGLIPRNVFEAAATGDLLPLLIFTFLFGGAASRLPLETRRPLAELIRSLAEAMMVLVGWVLWGTPLGVFALILGLTIQTGAAAVGFLGAYIVGVCALLILVMLLLYPVTAIFGRTSIGRFARAALPAQLVAASTQSSLASLPALVEGGRTRMRLPEAGTAFVLPLAVSTFKINQPISSVFKFLLLAHVFGVQLGVGQTVTFLIATILLSFSTAGVPRGGGGMKKLPLYLAAGIPIEGYVIIEAVKTIPDVFMTMANVTADMSAATILTRGQRDEAPEAAGLPEGGEEPAPVAVGAPAPAPEAAT